MGRHLTTSKYGMPMEKHPLLNLHPELQLSIVDRLERFRDLAALTLTCKALHDRLSPVLYRIVYRTEPDLLQWLCSQGDAYKAGAVRRLLDIGANPAGLHSKIVLRKDSGLLGDYATVDTSRQFQRARNTRKWISRGEVLPEPDKPCNWYRDELGRRRPGKINHDSSHELSSILEQFKDETKFKIQWSAIHIAAFNGHVEILEVLLDHDSQNGNHLIDSLVAGYSKIEETLPSRMRERHRLPRSPLDSFNEKRQLPQVQLWTLSSPLRAALGNQQQESAQLLIERGAKLEFIGPNGEIEHALHVAARHACHRIVRFLSSKLSIDLNIPDHTGWTPLCEAIINNRKSDTVTYLIDLGANVDASLGVDGFTALHLACYRRQWAHALTLLEAGADVEAIWQPTNGPCRAIDLICTDTIEPGAHYFDIPREEVNAPLRLDLLTRLIRTYRASISPCPGTTLTPLAIAATRSRVSLDLVKAFVKAQVYFHTDHTTVPLVLSSPASELDLGDEYTDGSVIAVARCLVRHGARVGSGPENDQVLARAVHRLLGYISAPKREGMLIKFAKFLGLLVVRAGMSPDIPSIRADGSVDGEKSLSRAMLCERSLDFNLAIGAELWRVGATPPGVLDFLRDWCALLPGLEAWEVAGYNEWRKKGMPTERGEEEEEKNAVMDTRSTGLFGSLTSENAAEEDEEDEESWADSPFSDDASDAPTDEHDDDFLDDEDEMEDEDDEDDEGNMSVRSMSEREKLKMHERKLENMRAIFLRTMLYMGPESIDKDAISAEHIYQGLFKDLTIATGSEVDMSACGIFMEKDELERWRREASNLVSEWLGMFVSDEKDKKRLWEFDNANRILQFCRRIRAGVVGLGTTPTFTDEDRASLTRR